MRAPFVALVLFAACTGREIDTRPADTGGNTGPFELEVPSYALQGQIYDVTWGPASDAFAIDDGGGAYRIFVAPFPLSACDEGERLTENVLYAEIPALTEAPWGDGAEVSLGTTDGLLTTTGGGYDLSLDVTNTKVEGGLLFDVAPQTRLAGQIEASLCP